tara:strand:+ start:807 stop:1109 length:303 start_codon:yes stop_codon:yes gene_type:complete
MTDQQEKDQTLILDLLERIIENEVSDWAIDKTETLWDDDEDELLRVFHFSKGLTEDFIVIDAEGRLSAVSGDCDLVLLTTISNILIDIQIITKREERKNE